MEEIYKYDIPIDVQDIDGLTPIMLACQKGKIDTFRFLLQNSMIFFLYYNKANFYWFLEARLDIKDRTGSTLLHKAAYGGNLDCVRLVLAKV